MARPAYERVGAAFRTAYEAAGLRQGDVAKALGVDQATVSKWARGVQRIDLEYFPEIDRVCRRPLGWVLTKAGFVDPGPMVDVASAVAADPALDEDGRNALAMLYEVLKTRAVQDADRTSAVG
jgi:transcriptional regulator with XRE-family HTH domain